MIISGPNRSSTTTNKVVTTNTRSKNPTREFDSEGMILSDRRQTQILNEMKGGSMFTLHTQHVVL